MNTSTSRPIRGLVYGHVNLNVVDGSAYFVAGLASLLTSDGSIELDVLAANPIYRDHVVREILENPAVRLIDPYKDLGRSPADAPWVKRSQFAPSEAARMVASYWTSDRYDFLFVRGTDVAIELIERAPELGPSLFLYVTGVAFANENLNDSTAASLRGALELGVQIVCQTPEMRLMLAKALGVEERGMIVLPPAVPDAVAPPLPDLSLGIQFAYTGKFAEDWHPLEILSGFGEARDISPHPLRMVVAGDQFKRSATNATFASEVRHLLNRLEGVTWLGAVPRAQARQAIVSSHVGISWRSSRLDQSLELSTKVLEYGILGRPSILNRTPMHERLLGADYPMYCDSMREYVDLLSRIAADPSLIERAGIMARRAAEGHTYSQVLGTFRVEILRLVARELVDVPARVVSSFIEFPQQVVEQEGVVLGPLRSINELVRFACMVDRAQDYTYRVIGALCVALPAGPSANGFAVEERLAELADFLQIDDGRERGTVAAGDVVLRSDVSGLVEMYSAAPVVKTERELRVRVQQLERELRGTRSRLVSIEKRYRNLSKSRLGRVQRWYWGFRKRA